ncbi:MAG: protease pro-enzyme activation domain-containing protein [Capsulimonas sp.]|uniref:S53 family peptidase n=1 Tax=Capsulimonas sp. TaxID=2494211 RepID=UPI0032636FC9
MHFRQLVSKPSILSRALISGAVLLALAGAPSHAQQMFGLRGHGSIHRGVAQARALAALDPSAALDLTISLPVHNQSALDQYLQQLYDPSSPNYHKYLSVAEFTQTYGPTEQDYTAVAVFLKARGFTVGAVPKNRMLVDVRGSVGAIEQTFHVHMKRYQHPTENRTFFGPDAEPTVDQPVPILDVTGLDDFTLPKPKNLHIQPKTTTTITKATGSGPGGLYQGNDFRGAYCPQVTLDGDGQTIAIWSGASYYPSDIATYCTVSGLPPANVTQVPINGAATTPSPGQDVGEQSLDIEMSHSMAPGAKIYLYFGGSAADTWNRIATDNIAKQVTCSISVSPPPSTLNQILQQMAAQGQSVFNASGDAGYSASPFGWDDNPYMTSVGGTNLTVSSSGGPRSLETGWGGSGGYISPNYAIPTWQQGISMTANGGSTTQRNCPDVAMISDNFWFVYNNGQSGGVGGTSGAAPLWAGFMALVNQQGAQHGKPTAGFINPAVYALGKGANYNTYFYDVTSGSNGKPAVTGYDLVTGWGSPKGQALIDALSGSSNYTAVASENQTVSFGTPVDVAYGANTSFFYKYAIAGSFTFSNATFGGDPIFGVAKSGYSKPFVKSVNEGSSATFGYPVEAAYGANGHYLFNWGTTGTVAFTNAAWGNDPAPNVAKSGYYLPYAQCAGEGGSVTFSAPTDVAYGANGHFLFQHAVTGTIVFNTTTFGSDPAYGTHKYGYYRPSH